jgi:hypothetical protein
MTKDEQIKGMANLNRGSVGVQEAQPAQEPTQWRDMVVVSLVREGIDKHKARELADHFAAQPEQKPVKLHEAVISAWSLREVYFDEDGEPSMHRSPPAAQRPWQGLTEEEKKKIATVAGCTDDDDGHIVTEIFRLAEAKLKEKNK